MPSVSATALGREASPRWSPAVCPDCLPTLPISDSIARFRPQCRAEGVRQRMLADLFDIVTDKASITQLTIGDDAKCSTDSVPRPYLLQHRLASL